MNDDKSPFIIGCLYRHGLRYRVEWESPYTGLLKWSEAWTKKTAWKRADEYARKEAEDYEQGTS